MDSVTITLDGVPIPAQCGESLAAALISAGVRNFRTTASGAHRSFFCGMGVCEDCLVEVDGKPNVRACMTKVTGPHVVRGETHRRALPVSPPARAPITIADVPVERPELLVIGAGPGGLSAAIAARRAGADVLVVDERSGPGGQYYKQLAVSKAGVPPADSQHREGAALIQQARDLGVRIMPDTVVWGAFEPQDFVATRPDGIRRFLPRTTVVATGAYERAWPVPGWTLPGVMTTGAGQSLWRTARRLPGRKVLIAGNGPLNLQLAVELLDGGANVVALAETAARPGLKHVGAIARMAAASPGLLRRGLWYHARRKRAGVEIHHGAAVARIEAIAVGLRVELRTTEGVRHYDVDAVCMGYGFEPSNELLRAIGCGHDFDASRRQLVTRRDDRKRTSVPGIFALGDCTGLGGAKAALAEGVIAGVTVAEDLGLTVGPDLAAERARAEHALARHRDFQKSLWQIFAPVIDGPASTPETVICRCEEVTFAVAEQAMDEGLSRIGDIKRRSRIGMGRCQGRYCGPTLQDMIARRFGAGRDEFSGFAPRLPIKPVSLDDIAKLNSP